MPYVHSSHGFGKQLGKVLSCPKFLQSCSCLILLFQRKYCAGKRFRWIGYSIVGWITGRENEDALSLKLAVKVYLKEMAEPVKCVLIWWFWIRTLRDYMGDSARSLSHSTVMGLGMPGGAKRKRSIVIKKRLVKILAQTNEEDPNYR